MTTDTRVHARKPTARAESALSPAELEQVRRALVTRRAQLLHVHEEREAEAAQEEVETGDVADVAEGVIEDRRRATLDEHDLALLGEIDHAIAKLDAGTYGVSEASGRPIPFARLLALPWTRLNADEASRLEHASGR